MTTPAKRTSVRRAPSATAKSSSAKAAHEGEESHAAHKPAVAGAAKAARHVTAQPSATVSLPVIGEVWLGRPKHLPFYVAIAGLAVVDVIDWPVAVLFAVGKLLADNAHRESLRDFGEALEEGA